MMSSLAGCLLDVSDMMPMQMNAHPMTKAAMRDTGIIVARKSYDGLKGNCRSRVENAKAIPPIPMERQVKDRNNRLNEN
jgi:hypothetical protein